MNHRRDWSVYAVRVVSEHALEYAKVRADEGAIGVGTRVSIQRQGETTWRTAHVVDKPADADPGLGSIIWLAWIDRNDP